MRSFIHFIILYQLPIYYAVSVMIDQLPKPSGKNAFYVWFFGVSQVVAANLVRSKLGFSGGTNESSSVHK